MIASKIRTSGAIVRDEQGDIIRSDDGKPIRTPGIFEQLQAAGWMYDETTAQVSMNLLNYSVTGLHDVTDAIGKEASKIGLEAISSELVGLVPLEAMLKAGRHYHEGENANESTLVRAAIDGLMLNRLDVFNAHSSIIEWAIAEGV
jgi:glutamate formiminotransferase/formiminotetrahydrofolate cyclodeaminase